MGSRLVLFIIFLCLAIGVLSFSNYKSYLNEKRDLSYKALVANTQKKAAKKNVVEEEPKEVVAQPKKPELTTEQLKRGSTVYYETGKCVQCHGEFGQGLAEQEAPMIAGQYDWYLLAQLQAIKSKERINEKMYPYIENLSEKDFEDVAAYITELRAGAKNE